MIIDFSTHKNIDLVAPMVVTRTYSSVETILR